MTRPDPIRVKPTCPHCGNPMPDGGSMAIACGPRGQSTRIALPAYCTDRQCQKDRDEAAMARAIASGLIDP